MVEGEEVIVSRYYSKMFSIRKITIERHSENMGRAMNQQMLMGCVIEMTTTMAFVVNVLFFVAWFFVLLDAIAAVER